jgi:rhodanese-related sulfurtransferase
MSNPVPSVGVQELFEVLRAGAALIDVREPHEYEEVRVPGAQLIPLQTVPDSLSMLPKGDPLYVVCRSGGRSHTACDWLQNNGVNAVNVLGGTLAWIEASFPTDSGSPTGSTSNIETTD